MKTILLNGQWKLSGKRQFAESEKSIFINATVPGDVQLDLCEAGYLPRDIFMGMNVKETEKFEDYEWWYERTFTAPEEKSNVWLVFEAVDCLAEYYLNGVKFGESKNAFISHEFCVDEYLVELSRDSMKSMAITMIEDRWQTEFRNSNFDGTIDEYIDYCYEVLKQKYTVVMYGLE